MKIPPLMGPGGFFLRLPLLLIAEKSMKPIRKSSPWNYSG